MDAISEVKPLEKLCGPLLNCDFNGIFGSLAKNALKILCASKIKCTILVAPIDMQRSSGWKVRVETLGSKPILQYWSSLYAIKNSLFWIKCYSLINI